MPIKTTRLPALTSPCGKRRNEKYCAYQIELASKDCDLGRIALAISPANPDVIYAMVEGFDKEHGGLKVKG
jgi:hypothetical protein